MERGEERSGRLAVTTLGFAVLYAAAMYAGRETIIAPSLLALAWPAAGVTVVWLLTARRPRECVLAASVIVVISGLINQDTGVEAVGAWLFGFVNAAHGLVGAAVLRRLTGWDRPRPITTMPDVGHLAVASVAGAAVSALSGGVVAWARFDTELWDGMWLIGLRNALSTFVVAAALLAVPALRRSVREAPGWCVAVVGLTLVVSALLMEASWPVVFAMIPPLLVVALRCGTEVTSVVVGVQGVIVVATTADGRGPFSAISPIEAQILVAQALILVLALVGLLLSVTENGRSRALETSRHDRDRLRDHMEAALVAGAHLVVDADGVRAVETNAALAALTRRERADLEGSDPVRWFAPSDAAAVSRGIRELVDDRNAHPSPGWRAQLRMAESHGGGWVDAALSLVDRRDAQGPVGELNLQMLDVTAQRHAEQQLAHAALHDELTGLANRTLWADRVEQALRQAGRTGELVAVLFVDIDHFKKINDTYGHDVGDTVLREVARRLSLVVRPLDTVARMGGDEFVVLCPAIGSQDDGLALADRIQRAIGTPVTADGRSVNVSASIGVGYADGRDAEPGMVLRRADTALYAAKDRGRARFEVYNPDLHADVERAARLLHDLEKAERLEQFVVVYQPVVDVDSGRVVALEALLRWDHPQRGRLLPAEFLDVLEASELIHQVGDHVLNRACRDGAALVARGIRLAMHVNVSARELARPGLVEGVTAALKESGFPADLLVLEITETRLVTVNGSLLRDLFALRDLGVELAVDDFGTGYSTLTHLVDLPVGIVKLDRSFVTDIATRPSSRSVSSGVRSMATGLGIDAIAEGVETAEQARILTGLGYRLMQGYLCGRPGTLEDLDDLLQSVAGPDVSTVGGGVPTAQG